MFKQFSARLRFIYLPFIIFGIGFILLYSVFNWLFVIRYQLVNVHEDIINFWLPLALPWIPLWLVLRPGVKLLWLRGKKGDFSGLYYFVVGFSVVISTIVAQNYLDTATGKLTTLESIEQLDTRNLTKYYELAYHDIDRWHLGVYKHAQPSGKYNQYLDLYCDVALPIMDGPRPRDTAFTKILRDSVHRPLVVINGKHESFKKMRALNPADIQKFNVLKPALAVMRFGDSARYGAVLVLVKRRTDKNDFIPKAWLGIEYKKEISNRLSMAEKDTAFRQFDREIDRQFRNTNFNTFVYLKRVGNNSRYKAYQIGMQNDFKITMAKPVVFEAVNEPFEDRNGDTLPWIFKSYAIGALVWLLMILIPKINPRELNRRETIGHGIEWKPLLHSLQAIKPRDGFFITPILIGINLLVFVVMVFAGLGFIDFSGSNLLSWGADYRPLVLQGQWWRLITSMFVHGGLMHILSNMYGLLFAAIFLEPALGRVKFTVVYFVCGIAASLTSIWWHPDMICVGASGAIFGLFGVFTAMLTTSRASIKQNKVLLINNLVFMGFSLLVGLSGGIDNAAHMGGLIAGLIIGYGFYFYYRNKPFAEGEQNEMTEFDK